MENFKIMDYTVRNCGDYYKVYDDNEKDVTLKFNDNVANITNNELGEVMDNIRASFVKDWKRISNKEIYKLLKWSYPLNDEDIVYINYGNGDEFIRIYYGCFHNMYIDVDIRNVRDLDIVKNIYKDGIDYIRKRVRYHDRYVIGKLLNSICDLETVAYFLVMLFDDDKDFYQVKYFNSQDEYSYIEYIKVDYGHTYEYNVDEDEDNIEKKVIEFRDFIMNVI